MAETLMVRSDSEATGKGKPEVLGPGVDLAAALDDDTNALRRLAKDGASVSRRAMPALWIRAQREGIEGLQVDRWRRQLNAVAAHHLVLEAALQEIGLILDEANVKWVPIKGMDLARRLYDAPEERLTSDLDLLISRKHFERARNALEANGWSAISKGPRYERYLLDDAYAWQVQNRAGVLLELHYRLWGQVPEAMAEFLVEAAISEGGLQSGGSYLPWAEAYVIAAVHIWLNPSPRDLVTWWDLVLIGDRAPRDATVRVPEIARRWSLELPIAMAAKVSSELWNRDTCRKIAATLAPDLRLLEFRLFRRTKNRLVDTALAEITIARFVAGRPSRGRWKSLWRRVWAHPGCVERATPESWSWPRRRFWYLKRSLGKSTDTFSRISFPRRS